MATKTSNYEFNKPEQNDFYDVDVQNENWDKVDEELSEFDDSGVTEDIKSFPDFLSKFVTGNKVAITLRNLKAGLQFVLHAAPYPIQTPSGRSQRIQNKRPPPPAFFIYFLHFTHTCDGSP